MTMDWGTSVTRLLGLEYPIVQAPMFGVTTSEMVAAASNSGCLGSLALADLDADICSKLIRETRKLTDKPFAVNIFAHTIPSLSEELKKKYSRSKRFLEDLAERYNLDVSLPTIEELKINSYHEQVDAIASEKCGILSFTFGNLDTPSIDKLKRNGTILIGTCTSVHEAIALEQSGIDIICVQGWEAGGHRGSFSSEDIPKIGGISLLTRVCEAVRTPVIYAGGICGGKTILAAKMLGAAGFQVGSLLLCATESALKDFEKERLRKVTEADIVLTKSFSGRFARGIKNRFIEELDNTDFILPYPYQNKLTAEIRKFAKTNNNADFTSIWTGQSIGNYSEKSTASILKSLIMDTEARCNGLTGL